MELRHALPQSSCGRPHDQRVPANQDTGVNGLTELCLSIAALTPGQFDAIADIINDYQRLFDAVSGAQERRTCSDRDTDLPLVSIGPSGIGGRFQRELRP